MCGIFGITGKKVENYKDSDIKSALSSLSQRGPDDSGFVRFENCILGQTRLSIIDLNTGHQPMTDEESGISIIFNGEIYNYKELKKDLENKGYKFKTSSDTEVILKTYNEYKEKCLDYLEGMFAFAIWDKKNETLFFARDRFGKKPLYYSFDNSNNLIFASEIKALFASGKILGEIDKQALDNYLELMYIPPHKSIYKNIFTLPPAHYAIYKKNKLDIKRYWSLKNKPIKISYDKAKKETLRLLENSVKKRMLASDVEVGSLLSGGVDSTIISLFAQKYLDQPLKTFSVGYGDYINELPYAKKASEIIGSEHHTLQASGNLIKELENVMEYFDEPHADSSDFPQHLISKLASSKVKVALSGDGADEIFLGYGWHNRHMNLSYHKHTLEKLFLSPFRGRINVTKVFSPFQRIALWGSFKNINKDIFMKGVYEKNLDKIKKISIFDVTTYLPGQLLTKVDRTGMMHGLEVRCPFLDTELVEFVFNLPIEYKIDSGEHKIILKDILSDFMPKEFVYRRKQGFGAPIGKWMKEPEMSDYVQKILGKDANVRKIFVSKTIDFLLSDFYKKNNDRNQLKLWILLCLEIWFKTHKKWIVPESFE